MQNSKNWYMGVTELWFQKVEAWRLGGQEKSLSYPQKSRAMDMPHFLLPTGRAYTLVSLSSTIRVCRAKKWLDTFVRGTVVTENSLNTHISRLDT